MAAATSLCMSFSLILYPFFSLTHSFFISIYLSIVPSSPLTKCDLIICRCHWKRIICLEESLRVSDVLWSIFKNLNFVFRDSNCFCPGEGGGHIHQGHLLVHHPRRCSEWSLRPNVNFRPFLKYRGWPLWSNLSLSSNVQQEHVYKTCHIKQLWL